MAGNYFENLDKYLAPQQENRFLSGNTTGEELSGPQHLTSISKLGATFGENDGRGQPNVLGSMLASIRQGSATLQLAMSNSPDQAGVGSISKARREEIKNLIKVSGTNWEGLELNPGSTSNLSGFNGQQGMFSDQQRKHDMQHVKDAIVFAGEIEAGGGVDVWSQEFQRGIADAGKRFDNGNFVDFEGYDPDKDAIKNLVDKRTGKLVQFSAAQINQLQIPKWETAQSNYTDSNGVLVQPGDYIDMQGNKLKPDGNDPNFLLNRVPKWNEKERRFESQTLNSWSEFEQYAQQRNQKEFSDPQDYLSPEEWFQRIQNETQYMQARGQSMMYTRRYNNQLDQLKHLSRQLEEVKEEEQGLSREELVRKNLLVPSTSAQMARQTGGEVRESDYIKKSELLQQEIGDLRQDLQQIHETSSLADAQAQQVWDGMKNTVAVEKYAKEKTFDSYADLGIFAMDETKRKKPLKPIYVGPELGFPQAYGGHPKEFVEIIKQSRQKMIEKMRQDPVYRNKYTDDQMKELSKKHIGGVLDTSHLSMWFNHFPKERSDESEEARLKRFNKWYLKQMKELGQEDVIKNVQIVDAMTGGHRHLPVGEGIFPTVDGVKELQKSGYDGAIVSEGHAENPTDPGSVQYSLWNAFGASLGSSAGYFGVNQGGNSFGNVYTGMGGAAGYRAPPNYIIGAYNPSNDWKLWSEVPLE